ncbi:MAG: flagellar basal body-associated FliL family protein [Desulfovibrionaceae bacterium]|nr:flagellar basal body-associated FliL family protein [Desulfovibrionaceae bacterium]
MAEEEQEKPKRTFLIIIIIAVVILILAGAGIAWFFLQDSSSQEETSASVEKKIPEEITLVTVPQFLVNLSDPLGRRFIKITISIEAPNPQVAAKVEKQMFQIRDRIILLLSSKTYGDLAALDSKLYLKNEIVERINQVIAPDAIRQIYISDMIIQ